MKLKYLFIVIFVVVILSTFLVMAKGNPKKNIQSCIIDDNLFSHKINLHTGYETFTYFSPTYEYLGMEQYDGEDNKVIDTFNGIC
ncbi:hypothetical protein GOV12_06335 [Candidatus Pacearchaeota archaeon]|nr:hypothetical protein [Candidatus Pacearchaeota archaeon]